ncbi:MAG: hypothetical protein PF447_01080 [Spirochaetaceae bacterium]|nr:hypothetical protein [Spirochaetaceae bacterium]
MIGENGVIINVVKKTTFLLFVFLCLVFMSCDTASGGSGGLSQNLQGTISSSSWNFVSGVALDSTDQWNIRLYPSDANPSYDPWNSNAYVGILPLVYFSMDKQAGPQSYTITTFGLYDGLGLGANRGNNNFVAFDSGQLEISSIDLENYTISGNISAGTNEGTSSLAGSFSVVIEH